MRRGYFRSCVARFWPTALGALVIETPPPVQWMTGDPQSNNASGRQRCAR